MPITIRRKKPFNIFGRVPKLISSAILGGFIAVIYGVTVSLVWPDFRGTPLYWVGLVVLCLGLSVVHAFIWEKLAARAERRKKFRDE